MIPEFPKAHIRKGTPTEVILNYVTFFIMGFAFAWLIAAWR